MLNDYDDADLANGAVGASRELYVARDLMERGYDVFRALSPDASCDLVAVEPGTNRPLRVEVRSENLLLDGTITSNLSRTRNEDKFDVYAAVVNTDSGLSFKYMYSEGLSERREPTERMKELADEAE